MSCHSPSKGILSADLSSGCGNISHFLLMTWWSPLSFAWNLNDQLLPWFLLCHLPLLGGIFFTFSGLLALLCLLHSTLFVTSFFTPSIYKELWGLVFNGSCHNWTCNCLLSPLMVHLLSIWFMDVSECFSQIFSDFRGFSFSLLDSLDWLAWDGVPVNSESLQFSSVLLKGLGVESFQESCNITGYHGPSTDPPFNPGVWRAVVCMLKGAVILVPTGWMFWKSGSGSGYLWTNLWILIMF